MIPSEEIDRLFTVAANAVAMGEAGERGAGCNLLKKGYERSLQLSRDGLSWGGNLAALYSEAISCYACAYLAGRV